ncbi:MAG: hypothetical protein AMXMBFR44_0530 [Candidatus Campbellbacteria bacterium]
MFAMQNLTAGQLNALVKKVGGEKAVHGILDGTLKFAVEVVKSVINLADFFKTRKGIWVSDEFRQRILAPALEMEETAPASVGKPYDLPCDMTDAEVRGKFYGNHVFEDTRAFCRYLESAITAQWGGESGDLLNNGYANLFYVRGVNEKGEGEVFTVLVNWGADDGEWYVSAYRLDGNRWYRGCRAFPSNC